MARLTINLNNETVKILLHYVNVIHGTKMFKSTLVAFYEVNNS